MRGAHYLLAFSLAANIALLPVAYSPTLRFFYGQWIAHQIAKVHNPALVVIGDSIGAGGMGYGRVDTINMASNGQTTRQIAAQLEGAERFRPRHILVVAGLNDAMLGEPDTVAIAAHWKQMLRDPRVIPALVTPTRFPDLNRRIGVINAVIAVEAKRAVRPILLPTDLAGPDGLLKLEFAEADGAHLRSGAYGSWREQLHQALR